MGNNLLPHYVQRLIDHLAKVQHKLARAPYRASCGYLDHPFVLYGLPRSATVCSKGESKIDTGETTGSSRGTRLP